MLPVHGPHAPPGGRTGHCRPRGSALRAPPWPLPARRPGAHPERSSVQQEASPAEQQDRQPGHSRPGLGSGSPRGRRSEGCDPRGFQPTKENRASERPHDTMTHKHTLLAAPPLLAAWHRPLLAAPSLLAAPPPLAALAAAGLGPLQCPSRHALPRQGGRAGRRRLQWS